MTNEDKIRLESELPPGWKIITKITQANVPNPEMVTHFGNVTMQAESETYNVVLEGSFSWIKRKAVSYSLGGSAYDFRNC